MSQSNNHWSEHEESILSGYEARSAGSEMSDLPQKVEAAVTATILGLDQGELRVCTKTIDGDQIVWITNEWIKKAILLYFQYQKKS